jgi:hypothetical protein
MKTANRLNKTSRNTLVPTQNAHGPNFYPRPNKSVRVRTAGAGPSRALAQPNPHALLRTQPPVACSSRPPKRGINQSVRVCKNHPIDKNKSMGTTAHRPQAQHRARSSEYPNPAPESTKSRHEWPVGRQDSGMRPGGAGRRSRAGGDEELEPSVPTRLTPRATGSADSRSVPVGLEPT